MVMEPHFSPLFSILLMEKYWKVSGEGGPVGTWGAAEVEYGGFLGLEISHQPDHSPVCKLTLKAVLPSSGFLVMILWGTLPGFGTSRPLTIS